MAPIRIGFIGLSAAGGWAAGAHMPYLRTSTKYDIVALCNSSLDSAKAAIKHFDLPSSTKAYDSAAELADDPDVDLVVCSVRVDRHYELIKPAVEKGKACFVEWPLGANLREAEELQALAHAKGTKTMVGLQARRSPVVNKVKELVENGVIGKVLSSTVVSSAGNFGAKEPRSLRYFNEKGVGGNMVSIHFGHRKPRHLFFILLTRYKCANMKPQSLTTFYSPSANFSPSVASSPFSIHKFN